MADEIALVTGAAAGIGAEIARQLATGGARVAVLDINEAAGAGVAAEIGGEFIRCDVSDYGDFEGAVAICVTRLGVPDYAQLNAGVMTVGPEDEFLPLEAVSLEQYRRIMGVNMDGVFYGMKALLPRMRGKGGVITATASGISAVPRFGLLALDPLYTAAKHAVIGLVLAVAEANEGGNLRINCICPGAVDTDIVPHSLRQGGFNAMTPPVIAAETVDLMKHGRNGEVRVRLSEAEPAFTVFDR